MRPDGKTLAGTGALPHLAGTPSVAARTALVAWLVTAVFYFYNYALRSTPSVMMPQLSEAFGVSAAGVASIAGMFYYGYAPFSLVAGSAMDRLGPRKVIPVAAAAVGIGAILFGLGGVQAASIGRALQGAGGVFALVGAAYIATKSFPASRAATLIGATQMFGMSGGSAGQFLVGPMIAGGLSLSTFWTGMGVIGLGISVLLFLLLPARGTAETRGDSRTGVAAAFATVFRNPQSILCGLVAGLMFIPTTIFDMVWGVRFLEEARGFAYSEAVIRSATVPLGWAVGCPLLGFISDRIGRRKPVIILSAVVLLLCLAWILYGPTGVFPPYVLGFVAGLSSGAAMLPYIVIKEANPPEVSGTATGVINFLNFTVSALLGPVFGWIMQSTGSEGSWPALERYQAVFSPLLYGVGLAIVLAFLLKETGPAAKESA